MELNGILVNSNTALKDTRAVDLFIEEHIFMNQLIKRKHDLMVGATEIEIDARFDYRPDRVAFDYYGQDFWFPAILAANNIGSLLQFKAEFMNFKCWIPAASVIRDIIGSEAPELITPEGIADTVFKT